MNYFKSVKSQERKLKIYTDLISFDWLAFNQVYAPIMKYETINLYSSFFYQKQIFNFLNIDSYNLDIFLKNLKIENKTFETCMSELKSLDLVKLSIKSNVDSSLEYLIRLKSPLSIKEVFKKDFFKNKLKETVTEEKFSELILLSEENEWEYEVNLDKFSGKEKNKNQENILDKELYCDFYNEIFKNLGSEFSIDKNVLELIKIYYCDQKKINLKKLKHFAYMSIKKQNEKYFVSEENFHFLINNELNKNKKEFNPDKYQNFWKNLLDMSTNEAKKEFNNLFSEYESVEFYKKLSNKDKSPLTLNKWIKDCIQNKNFSFSMINATISFVNSLLRKIPINYLIKISETLSLNGEMTFESFINHIKNVIKNDISNKNRLEIKTDTKIKNFSDANNSMDFISYLVNN